MTATLSGTVATYANYQGASQSIDYGSALPTSLTAFGHTITAVSTSESSISGPIITTGGASLVENTTTTGTTSGTYSGATETQTITIKGGVGGGCTKPPCPQVQPELVVAPPINVGAIFSGVAFVAGVVALVLVLPEMTALAVALAVIDVLASFAALCWELIWK
jgi:hypothetical protein